MKSKLIACTVAAGLAVSLAAPAHANGLFRELRVGELAHDVPDLWGGFRVVDAPVAFNFEAVLTPSLPFLGGAIRPAIGASVTSGDSTSSAYLDARWEFETSAGIFFGLGLGVVVHNGQEDLKDLDLKALGSTVLFHIPFEVGLRLDAHNSLSVYFEHMSNGEFANFNEGLDRLGVRYGYRF